MAIPLLGVPVLITKNIIIVIDIVVIVIGHCSLKYNSKVLIATEASVHAFLQSSVLQALVYFFVSFLRSQVFDSKQLKYQGFAKSNAFPHQSSLSNFI